jgi:DNA polymerase-3 subunit alpha
MLILWGVASHGYDSPMATMPVLDTCTEVTATIHYPGRGGKFKLPTLTDEYLV